jgi:hypothetical protein
MFKKFHLGDERRWVKEVDEMDEICFYCHKTKGEHLGDADELYCDPENTCSFTPISTGYSQALN